MRRGPLTTPVFGRGWSGLCGRASESCGAGMVCSGTILFLRYCFDNREISQFMVAPGPDWRSIGGAEGVLWSTRVLKKPGGGCCMASTGPRSTDIGW